MKIDIKIEEVRVIKRMITMISITDSLSHINKEEAHQVPLGIIAED